MPSLRHGLMDNHSEPTDMHQTLALVSHGPRVTPAHALSTSLTWSSVERWVSHQSLQQKHGASMMSCSRYVYSSLVMSNKTEYMHRASNSSSKFRILHTSWRTFFSRSPTRLSSMLKQRWRVHTFSTTSSNPWARHRMTLRASRSALRRLR